MTSVAQFSGAIPGIYDQDLGPLLFHWSAERLGERVRAPAGGRVLEVACGTGISTQALRGALAPDVQIVATDLNEGMLAEATRRRGALPKVTYLRSDAGALPFPGARFDAVVCQFGLMFFPDRVAALREALRVLRPGGELLYSVWGSLDHNPPVRVVHETIREFFPDDPPCFLETPFGLHEEETLRELFEAAGAVDVEVEVSRYVAEVPSARGPAYGLVAGNPGVAEIQQRGGATVEEIVDAAEVALAAGFGANPMRAPLQAIFVQARKRRPAVRG